MTKAAVAAMPAEVRAVLKPTNCRTSNLPLVTWRTRVPSC
jgi:hypothetical protein